MKEEDFIDLALRYLDQSANQREVEQLGAAMLDEPAHRELYRDLAQQAQLAHEWHAGSTTLEALAPPPRRPIPMMLLAGAAAAALALIAFFVWKPNSPSSPEPNPETVESPQGAPLFAGTPPSWSDIYASPFDYPDFVWRAEITADSDPLEVIDVFSDSGLPIQLAEPAAAFSQLLAPIVLLPDGASFGVRL